MTEPPRPAPSLAQALASLPQGTPVSFAELSAKLGSRSHGAALLLLAIPDAVPLPIPSLSAVLGVPMLVVALHLAVYGEGAPLPGWLGRRQVPAAVIGLLRDRLAGVLARAERMSVRRWQWLAGRERLIGAVAALLALLLLLPLPFFNTPPAICLALLAWGLIRRDGAFVLVAMLGAAAVVVLVAAAAIWGIQLL